MVYGPTHNIYIVYHHSPAAAALLYVCSIKINEGYTEHSRSSEGGDAKKLKVKSQTDPLGWDIIIFIIAAAAASTHPLDSAAASSASTASSWREKKWAPSNRRNYSEERIQSLRNRLLCSSFPLFSLFRSSWSPGAPVWLDRWLVTQSNDNDCVIQQTRGYNYRLPLILLLASPSAPPKTNWIIISPANCPLIESNSTEAAEQKQHHPAAEVHDHYHRWDFPSISNATFERSIASNLCNLPKKGTSRQIIVMLLGI